jgi:acyl-homoserine lactone acylase PvdQ
MDRRLFRESVTLPGGELLPEIWAERTLHGPVTARGMLGELPVAISRKRSTYLKELDSGISILRMNRGVDTAEGFVDAFATGHNLSTNWAFVSDDEIAYFHGGLFGYRPDDVHPDFPVWGTGEWEWRKAPAGSFDADAYYPGSAHPHEIQPARDFAVSWNNRPAPNWGANDANWGFSSQYRVDLLEDQVLAEEAAGRRIDPVRLTQIMEHAGLTDLRGSHILPLVFEVLDAAPAPSQRAARMRQLLEDWVAPVDNYAWGALRRDGDRDGAYEQQAAIAIMDAWWTPMIHAMFDPALGRPVSSVSRQGFHDAPGPIGSAFQGGFYGQVRTDLELALGNELASPTSQVYCGSASLGVDGQLVDCARVLWQSLDDTGAALAAEQEAENPDAWTVDAEAERITFTLGFVASPGIDAIPTMHWVNRPTTQVLASFGDRDVGSPGASDPTPTPTTGGGLAVLAVVVAAAGGWNRRRRGWSAPA